MLPFITQQLIFYYVFVSPSALLPSWYHKNVLIDFTIVSNTV